MNKKTNATGISFFEKNKSIWVLLCMMVGVLIGELLPGDPAFLTRFENAKVSIPIAILIWLMIFPMMMKVDFSSLKNVRREPIGLYITWTVYWLVKPFTMFGITSLFFYHIFAHFIDPALAREYVAGAVILWAAPCTAMVSFWSHLTRGKPTYTVVQVATNDLIILFAFVPMVGFLLGISGVSIPWDTLFLSVVLFVVIPLSGGIWTRSHIIKKQGEAYFRDRFLPKFNNVTIVGLLLTLVLILSLIHI